MVGPFILIPGRTARQGCGISEGKFGVNYQEEIHVLQVAAEDMQRLQLANGDRVRLTSPYGQVEVPVVSAKGDELPAGLLFIPYGDHVESPDGRRHTWVRHAHQQGDRCGTGSASERSAT